MTTPGYTHVTLCIDRSGSMSSMSEEATNGINRVIKDQADLPGRCTISLYQFDDVYEKVFGPVAPAAAPSYTLHPRGMTALNDSVYKAIEDTGNFLSNLPASARPSKVLFVVVTDGAENASQEIKVNILKEKITHQTNKYNWEFMYIGANVDSFSTADALGMARGVNYASTGASASAMYSHLSKGITHAHLHYTSTLASSMPSEINAEGIALTTDEEE